MNIFDYLNKKFNNKKCSVLGFGRSNRPLVKMLLEAGAFVVVRDGNAKLLEDREVGEFAERGVEFIVGEGYLENMECDYIFRSPGIRHDLPEILSAVKSGAILTSEMELFFEICPCRIFGITGSDGKTTTTTLTHLILKNELEKSGRRAYVGGNIGSPLLPLVYEMHEDDIAVVELSSFQLQTMKVSPSRAIITNITPNHLNWHTDMDEYIAAKCNICFHSPVSMLVANAENAVTREIAKNSDLPITYFSSVKKSFDEIVPYFKDNCSAIYESDGVIYFDNGSEREAVIKSSDILIPGRHNVENYMAAIAITRGYAVRETVESVAKTFGGVSHRLELVREKDGVRFYNSSIDSSPTRTAAALSALSKPPIIICGGSDKNIPFDGLAKDLCHKVKAVVLTGQSAPKIFAEIEKCPDYDPERLTVKWVSDFREATLCAASLAEKGDIVLLSPACASFDAFKNFEERGNYFKEIVNNI